MTTIPSRPLPKTMSPNSCFLDPYEVRAGKENLFETDNYPRVFSGRPMATYLGCFWLRSAVRRQSKGRPQRAYAAWLVLHMLWADITAKFPGGKQHEDLVWYLQREPWDAPGTRALARAIDALFKDALRFFRKNRGRGEEAADISTFFKVRGLPAEFGRFRERPSRASRSRYRKSIDRFVTAVHKSLEDQAV
ncbi:MAG: hypothetical protein HY613_06700 [Candidatus Rokubacteria bacterium]|nr:hypothetical protein [Candidatus Rokubacteria bacterium]